MRFYVFLLLLILIAFHPLTVFAKNGPAGMIDDRFGLGGDAQMISELNVPWGTSFNFITDESDFINKYHIKTYFFLGWLGYGGWLDFGNMTDLENLYLKDSQDRADYTRLNTLLNPREDMTESQKNYIRVSWFFIYKFTKNYAGSYYAIGNEQDWGLYMTPDEYADYYNIFFTRIKKYDASAKVMIGGLVGFLPTLISLNLDKVATVDDPYKWIRQFWESYRQKYGSYPTIDVWNIHPYAFKHFLPGTIIARVEWQSVKQDIINFKDVFLKSIGEDTKPLWLTEIGINNISEGEIARGQKCSQAFCLTPEEQYEEWRYVAEDFLLPLIDWLKNSDYSERWFWYGAFYDTMCKDVQNNNIWYAECIYRYPDLYAGFYNPLGVIYQDKTENQIIINRGFEAAGIKPFKWEFWKSGTESDYTAGFDEVQKHTGDRSVKLHVGSKAGQGIFATTVHQTFSVSNLAGKKLNFSAWTKTDSLGQAGLIVSMGFNDGSAISNWRQSKVFQAQYNDWTKISTGYLSIPENAVWIGINGAAYNASGTAWFDDFEIDDLSNYGDIDESGQINSLDFATLMTSYQSGNSTNDLNLLLNNFYNK